MRVVLFMSAAGMKGSVYAKMKDLKAASVYDEPKTASKRSLCSSYIILCL